MPSPFFYFLTTCKGLEQEVTHQLIWAYLFNSPTVVEIVFGFRPPNNSYCRREPERGICDLEVYDPEGKSLIGIELKMWSYVSDAQLDKQKELIKKRNKKYHFCYLLLGTSQYEFDPPEKSDDHLIKAEDLLGFFGAFNEKLDSIHKELQRATDSSLPQLDQEGSKQFLEEYRQAVDNQQQWLETHWQLENWNTEFQPYPASYFMRNRAVQEALKEKGIDAIVYRNQGNSGFGLEIRANLKWLEKIEVQGAEGRLIIKLEDKRIALLWHPKADNPKSQKAELSWLRKILNPYLTQLQPGSRSGKKYPAVAQLRLQDEKVWKVEELAEILAKVFTSIKQSDLMTQLQAQ
ncbi:MAG: PD-(D/E)XK nuclease family protein [Bacteroidota bacterium]